MLPAYQLCLVVLYDTQPLFRNLGAVSTPPHPSNTLPMRISLRNPRTLFRCTEMPKFDDKITESKTPETQSLP
jgi:hypothetical protein